MPTDVILPQMGESITEGTITKWRVAVGDAVDRDDPLFDLATDKVDTEVPAAVAGTLAEILVAEGETVAVNTVVARIAAPGEESGKTAPSSGPAAAVDDSAPGSLTGGAESAEPMAAAVAADSSGEGGPGPRKRPRSSPLVRRMAKEHGADLAEVPGTGEGGRVSKRDMLAWIERLRSRAPAVAAPPSAVAASPPAAATSTPIATDLAPGEVPPPTPGPPPEVPAPPTPPPPPSGIPDRPVPQPVRPPAPSPPVSPSPSPLPSPLPSPVDSPPLSEFDAGARAAEAPPPPDTHSEPMSRMRRSIAEHMTRSRRTAAHVTTVFEVDLSEVVAVREQQAASFEQRTGVRLTLMPFFARATVDALADFPLLNASLDGDRIVHHRSVHLGIAVALRDGLIVPVLDRADERNFVGTARGIADLAARARSGSLRPEEVSGGTFTITNPGPYGALFGTPIIAQPQSAILGIGGVHKRAVVVAGDAIAVRSMVFLALSFDHRLIDGAVADRFLGSVKQRLETWREAPT